MKLKNRLERINQVLEKYLPSADQEPKKLHQAMRYSVLGAGKRIRPLLVYAAGETFGVDLKQLDIPACAIELVHSYSLIHDDLPAMDNDDFRRGKPSCHKAFDEATAILAGNALFNLAFEILAQVKNLEMITTLTKACGSFGMVGGQIIDLEENKQLTIEQLAHMHKLKTGALIRASIKLGALTANSIKQKQLEILNQYAQCIGLAFQIQDDILDNDGYVSLLGIEKAKSKLQQVRNQALQCLDNLNTDTITLKNLTLAILSH
jgi:farnesyl diphosphate synthase